MTLYTPHDKVYNALNRVYGTDRTDAKSETRFYDTFFREPTMVHAATISVLSAFTEAYTETDEKRREYRDRNIFREVTLAIWNVFPGGTTAEFAAERVFEALGMEVEK